MNYTWSHFYEAWMRVGFDQETAGKRADEWETETRDVNLKHANILAAAIASTHTSGG